MNYTGAHILPGLGFGEIESQLIQLRSNYRGPHTSTTLVTDSIISISSFTVSVHILKLIIIYMVEQTGSDKQLKCNKDLHLQ